MSTRITYRNVLIAVAILIMAAGATYAQTNKGDMIVEGNFSLASTSGDLNGGNTTTIFSLQPRFYYFLVNNAALGGRLGLTSVSGGGSTLTSFLIGPDFDYYFKTESRDIYPFAGAGLFLTSVSDGSSSSGFTLGLHGGLAYLLKHNLAIKPELEIDLENRDSNSGTTIMLGVGLSGFLY